MARKSYHGKVGVKFKAPWTTSKNKSMLRNLVTELIISLSFTVRIIAVLKY